MSASRIFAVVTAAGRSRRMGLDKLTLTLLGRPLLVQTVTPFLEWNSLAGMALSVSEGREAEFRELLGEHFPTRREAVTVLAGGAERQDSIRLALEALARQFSPGAEDLVLIHDGARPFIDQALLEAVLQPLSQFDGVIPAAPVRDTIKRVEGNKVVRTEDRQTLRLVQTPQAFRFQNILELHRRAHQDAFLGTDDASLLEQYGQSVGWTEGPVHNLKVTVAEDIPMMEELGRRLWSSRV